MWILDSNICIYLIKKKDPKLREKLFSHDPEEIAVSAVTVYELSYGAEKSHWGTRNRETLDLFLAPLTILPFDSKDAVTAGKIRSYLERMGTPIGPYDLMIAAQGITRQHSIVTNNIREFERIPGLKLENWC